MITTSYQPNIQTDANGYPVTPGFASMRTAQGTLDPRFAVTAPVLSDYSKWNTLQRQGLGQQGLVNMDTARQKGMAVAPAQGAASLSSGSRGIAALQGLAGTQSGIAGQGAQQAQKMLGLNEELLKNQMGQTKQQTLFNQAAAGANQAALQRDLDAANAFQLAEYQNALKRQQGIDMRNAQGGGGSTAPGPFDQLVNAVTGKDMGGAAGIAALTGWTLPAIAGLAQRNPKEATAIATGRVIPALGQSPNLASPVATGVASLNSLLPGGGGSGPGIGSLAPAEQLRIKQMRDEAEAAKTKKQVTVTPQYGIMGDMSQGGY